MQIKDFDNLVTGAKLVLTKDTFFRVFANRHLEKKVFYPPGNGASRGTRWIGWRDMTLTIGTTFYIIDRDPMWNSYIVAFDHSTASRKPIMHSPEEYTYLIYTELTREDAPHLELIH